MEISRVGDFSLGWGESVIWDDRRSRLYFVDCAANTLHWLDDGDGALHTLLLPSMVTGIVPTEDDLLVGVLDDGLHVIDPDLGTTWLIARYPDEIEGRGNDACADLGGNLITGKLNLAPAAGSAWWYSATAGWRVIDRDISNTNGPAVGVIDGASMLIIGDTSADYFSYPYDSATGRVGERSVFGDTSGLEGRPDGATLDDGGLLWCALVGGGQLARFSQRGLGGTVPLSVTNPTDVTFGGPGLDRLYVVSIGMDLGSGTGELDGALLVIDGLEARGRREPRFAAVGGNAGPDSAP